MSILALSKIFLVHSTLNTKMDGLEDMRYSCLQGNCFTLLIRCIGVSYFFSFTLFQLSQIKYNWILDPEAE